MPEVYFTNVCFLPFCYQLINSQKAGFVTGLRFTNEDLAMFQCKEVWRFNLHSYTFYCGMKENS